MRQASCVASVRDCKLLCSSSTVRLLASLPMTLTKSKSASPLKVVNVSGVPLWIGCQLEDGSTVECAAEAHKEVLLGHAFQLPITVRALGHTTSVTNLPLESLQRISADLLLQRSVVVYCGPLSFLCTHSVDRSSLSSTLCFQSMFAIVNRSCFDVEVSSPHIPSAAHIVPSSPMHFMTKKKHSDDEQASGDEEEGLHCFPWPLIDDPSTQLTLLTRPRPSSHGAAMLRQRSSSCSFGSPRSAAQRLLNEGASSVNTLLEFHFGGSPPTCITATFHMDPASRVATLILLPASFILSNELPFPVTLRVFGQDDDNSGERSAVVECVLGIGETLPLHRDPSGDEIYLEASASLPCGEFQTIEPLLLSDVGDDTSVVFIENRNNNQDASPQQPPSARSRSSESPRASSRVFQQGSPNRTHYAHRFEISASLRLYVPPAMSEGEPSVQSAAERANSLPQVISLRAIHAGILINRCGLFVQVVGTDGNPVGTLGDSNLPDGSAICISGDRSNQQNYGLVPLQTDLHLYNTKMELSTAFDLPKDPSTTKGHVLFCVDARGIADVSCNIIVRPVRDRQQKKTLCEGGRVLQQIMTITEGTTGAYELLPPIVVRNASTTHKLFFRHLKAQATTSALRGGGDASVTAVATVGVNPRSEMPHYTVVTSPSIEMFAVAYVPFDPQALGDMVLVPADDLFSKPFPLRLHAGTDATIVIESGIGSHHALRVAKGELCDTCFITVGGPRLPLVTVVNLTQVSFKNVQPLAVTSLTPRAGRDDAWDTPKLLLAEAAHGNAAPVAQLSITTSGGTDRGIQVCHGTSWTARCDAADSAEFDGPCFVVTIASNDGHTELASLSPTPSEHRHDAESPLNQLDLDFRLNCGTLQATIAAGNGADPFSSILMERASFWISSVRGVTTGHGTISGVAVEDLMIGTETRHALAPLSFDLMVKGVRVGASGGRFYRQILVDSVAVHTTRVVVCVNDHFVCKWPHFGQHCGVSWEPPSPREKTPSQSKRMQTKVENDGSKWHMTSQRTTTVIGIGKFVVSDITLTLTWIRNGAHDSDILRRFLLGWILGTIRGASLVLPAYVFESPLPSNSASVHYASLQEIVLPMVSFYGTALVRQLGSIFGAYDIFGAPMTFVGGVVAGMGAFVAAPLTQKIPSLLKKTVSGTSSWFASLTGFGSAAAEERPEQLTGSEALKAKSRQPAAHLSTATSLQDSQSRAVQEIQRNAGSPWLCTDCTTIYELLNDESEPIPPMSILCMFGMTAWAHHIPYEERLELLKGPLSRKDVPDDETYTRFEELRNTALGIFSLSMFSSPPQRPQPTVVALAPGDDTQQLVHALSAKRDFVALGALLQQGRLPTDDAANWSRFLRLPAAQTQHVPAEPNSRVH